MGYAAEYCDKHQINLAWDTEEAPDDELDSFQVDAEIAEVREFYKLKAQRQGRQLLGGA